MSGCEVLTGSFLTFNNPGPFVLLDFMSCVQESKKGKSLSFYTAYIIEHLYILSLVF